MRSFPTPCLTFPERRHVAAPSAPARRPLRDPALGHRRHLSYRSSRARAAARVAGDAAYVDRRQGRALAAAGARGRRVRGVGQVPRLARLRSRLARARAPALRRATAHARVGTRERREPRGLGPDQARLRPRARTRLPVALHEREAKGAAPTPCDGRPVRIRGSARRSARRADLEHPGRARRRRVRGRADRARHAHARDQPVHGPALSQLPQLAGGLVRGDRRLCGEALRRPRTADRRLDRHRAPLRRRDPGAQPHRTEELDRPNLVEAIACDLATRHGRAVPRLGSGPHGHGGAHARRRSLRHVEPLTHRPLLQPASRRRQQHAKQSSASSAGRSRRCAGDNACATRRR